MHPFHHGVNLQFICHFPFPNGEKLQFFISRLSTVRKSSNSLDHPISPYGKPPIRLTHNFPPYGKAPIY
jgi:hypothetical protein